jgi:acetyl-CoA carboxylase biotin carboxyl carrier protein
MAGASSNQDVFDVRKIRRLVELMEEHDLSELDLRQGDMRIQLRREAEPVISVVEPQRAAEPVARPSPHAEAPREAPPRPESATVEEHVALIKSPIRRRT